MDFRLVEEGIKNLPVFQAIAPFVFPLIMAGASALGGYLNSRGKKTQDTSGSYTNLQETTPQYDPAAWGARNTVLEAYQNRLSGRQGYLTGYTGQGMRKINRTADLRSQALSNILSSRGLSSSPMAAALETRGEDERLREQIEFLNQLPLMERGLETEDLQGLGGFVSSLPTGMRTSSSGTSTGQQVGYSSQSGAVGQGIGDAISAYLMGRYYLRNKGSNTPQQFQIPAPVNLDIFGGEKP